MAVMVSGSTTWCCHVLPRDVAVLYRTSIYCAHARRSPDPLRPVMPRATLLVATAPVVSPELEYCYYIAIVNTFISTFIAGC